MKALPKEHIVRIWLAAAAVATVLMLTTYTLVQQLSRLGGQLTCSFFGPLVPALA